MKIIIIYSSSFLLACNLLAQETRTVELIPPDTDRGLPIMKSLSLRASATEWVLAELNIQDCRTCSGQRQV
jgi:hypothetical protein